jgi:hypothetical protein
MFDSWENGRMASPTLTALAVRDLADGELLAAQRALAAQRREVDAQSAVVAAEIAYRSRRELGSEGLAQRLGARTAEKLVQRMTGTTARDSQTLVRVGSIPAESPIATAVSSGVLGVDAAKVIHDGLGDSAPDEVVSAMISEAEVLSVEKLAGRARDVRAELDEDGIADREQHLRDQRYLRLSRLSDGMTRLTGLLDPESAAVIVAAYDGATTPRRGGPRFVDPDAATRADELVRDERESDQIALDAFVELIRLGVDADSTVLPARRPAVRVLVTERDLSRRAGAGYFEGQSVPISIATVDRHICSAGVVPVLFDSDGQAVNVGREQRLFTTRQRVGLAARDGGCLFPQCDRPPSWCEAHHVNPWSRGGNTDLADGVLLCKHHHLLIHNNGWEVKRRADEYVLIPPRSLDPRRTPIPAPSKNPLARRLLAG